MAMRMSEKKNDQIQYHNSREQLHRLKNVPDVQTPSLDSEKSIPRINEAKADITNSAADSSVSGVKGGVTDFAVPLFTRQTVNPRIKMVKRWDVNSDDVKELIKELPKLKTFIT